MKCDFCSSPDIFVCYPAESSAMFATDGKKAWVGQSTGGWVACAECSRLIDAGDRAGLAKRSAETFPKALRSELNQESLRQLMSMIQEEMFWPHFRKGPGVPIL